MKNERHDEKRKGAETGKKRKYQETQRKYEQKRKRQLTILTIQRKEQ